MYGLKEYEIEDIKKFLEIDSLDDEIFNNYFVFLGFDIEEIYNNYVNIENNYPKELQSDIVSLEEFKKVIELKLEDRFYSEINKYIKFSDNCIYYINDNTLLG
jgi:hypothetical protein